MISSCKVRLMDEHSGDNYSKQLSAKILFLFAFEFEEKLKVKGMWMERGAVAEKATLGNTFSNILGNFKGTKRHTKAKKAQ